MKKFLSILISTILILSTINFTPIYAQENNLVAFPGAEGGGMYTLGARATKNMSIVHVTNLNNSGAGSFREAVSGGNRIIVFDVAGTIMLESDLKVYASNITILGQTAPGEGICVGGSSVRFLNCDNIIVRYMRFRSGDYAKTQEDGLGFKNCSNVILDHCSISWSVDECLSAYAVKNFTAQNCIISESLNNSIHNKGDHGYGGIWGGINASFHHNLISTHNSRNPRIGTSQTVSSYQGTPDYESLVDIRNNVFYNWGANSGYGGENNIRVNFVNNYYKPTANSDDLLIYKHFNDVGSDGTTLYVSGNVMENNSIVTNDNWLGVSIMAGKNLNWTKCESISDGYVGDAGVLWANDQYIYDYPVTTTDAYNAYDYVLENAGASYKRDVTDERIINDVINGTYINGSKGSIGFIDSQNDVGGWCYIYEATAGTDTDNDGIPDEWEDKNGLDKNNSKDALALSDNGYTNIEEYANEIVKNPVKKNVNRIELNLAILNGSSLDLDAYYQTDADKIQQLTEKAKVIFNTSDNQQEIDNITKELNELLDSVEIMYMPLLQALVNEMNTIDTSIYALESLAEFKVVLNKANQDLALTEDNLILKADYNQLKEAYEKLEISTLPELITKLEEINANYIQKEELYTENSILTLKNVVSQAQQLAESNTYTNDSIAEMIEKLNECVKALVKIKTSDLSQYIYILENGILAGDYLTNSSVNLINELIEQGNTLLNSNLRENTEIDLFIDKVTNTIQNKMEYKNNYKTVKYMEGFENSDNLIYTGNVTFANEADNTYIALENDFKFNFPTEFIDDDMYLSTDFMLTDITGNTVLHGYNFDNTFNCTISVVNKFDLAKPKIRIYYSNDKNYVDMTFIDNVDIDINTWNNITSNYRSDTGILKIYYNNMLVYSNKITNKLNNCTELTGYNITNPYLGTYLVQNKNSYIDNLSLFVLGNQNPGCVYGDADNDGVLTANDSSVVLQKVLNNSYIMPVEKLSDDYIKYLDVDCSNDLTAADSAEILQRVLNGSYKMPVENEK